jgi:hypothetical protein
LTENKLLAHWVIKNEFWCQSVCAKPSVGIYEKVSVGNIVYRTFFPIAFLGFGTKTYLRNLILDLIKGFGTKSFFPSVRKRFYTKPKKDLSTCPGAEPF